jgi:hypothetical protein
MVKNVFNEMPWLIVMTVLMLVSTISLTIQVFTTPVKTRTVDCYDADWNKIIGQVCTEYYRFEDPVMEGLQATLPMAWLAVIVLIIFFYIVLSMGKMEVKMEKKLKCPRCKKLMDKLNNGKYTIDKCPSCQGIWLDKDEIVHINKQGLISYIADYFRRDSK